MGLPDQVAKVGVVARFCDQRRERYVEGPNETARGGDVDAVPAGLEDADEAPGEPRSVCDLLSHQGSGTDDVGGRARPASKRTKAWSSRSALTAHLP